MKSKYIAVLIVLASVGVLFAQTLNVLQTPRVNGTPTVAAEKGSILADATADTFYFKTGGNNALGWKSFNPSVLSGALSGTAVLVNGTVSITNTSLTTNSVLLLSGMGTATNAGSLTYTRPDTNGVVTVSSVTNSAVNALDNRTVLWLSIGN